MLNYYLVVLSILLILLGLLIWITKLLLDMSLSALVPLYMHAAVVWWTSHVHGVLRAGWSRAATVLS